MANIGTWRDKSEETFWPKDLLPTDCPTARILSFGYNADFAKFYPDAETIAPELTIDDYSTSLLEALKVLRGDTESVSHGLPSSEPQSLFTFSNFFAN
jgi:protein SERAC1